MDLPKSSKGDLKYKKYRIKPCQYPGCESMFNARGYSKYCLEHRDKKYRKEIDKLKKKDLPKPDNNQYFHHHNTEVKEMEFTCALCGEKFMLRVYPNIYTYPKYCEPHRNEFKRLMWQKAHYVITPPVASQPIVEEIEEETPIPEDLPAVKEQVEDNDEVVITDFEDDIEHAMFGEVED